ncbi:11914_t:CDS:1, partial [Gigaspora rosea]
KYLRIVAEGWDNKPEKKRIKMDEMLLKFLDIEAELNNKSKKNYWNLLDVLQIRAILFPITGDIHFGRPILFLIPSDISQFHFRLQTIFTSAIQFYFCYKRHSLQLKSKENLAPNLESVGEYTLYALKSPADLIHS